MVHLRVHAKNIMVNNNRPGMARKVTASNKRPAGKLVTDQAKEALTLGKEKAAGRHRSGHHRRTAAGARREHGGKSFARRTEFIADSSDTQC